MLTMIAPMLAADPEFGTMLGDARLAGANLTLVEDGPGRGSFRHGAQYLAISDSPRDVQALAGHH